MSPCGGFGQSKRWLPLVWMTHPILSLFKFSMLATKLLKQVLVVNVFQSDVLQHSVLVV